ncbi:lysosomal amino acid transporter 1 homolog isoform X2 [Pteropus medius]|uniref:lysosomal amino acid transporter 1 homolog isoform X2 n=1 Tax=Pteropus vampyrus TaxID=132908 RepID=UPI00196ADFFB|nr:lysosomal amino acid transporter 1 homolog isoform X2 [Pteropus giganteus]
MVWKKLGFSNFSSCPNGSRQWIWDLFGECAQDGWDEASVGLGLVSILCFAASTFPQYIKACKTGNMDQALSVWFLLGWIGGDSCNLIGSFLADQLPLQVMSISQRRAITCKT